MIGVYLSAAISGTLFFNPEKLNFTSLSHWAQGTRKGPTLWAPGGLIAFITTKYHSINDALDILGYADDIRKAFINFQKHLYNYKVAW